MITTESNTSIIMFLITLHISETIFNIWFPVDTNSPTPVLLPGKSHGWRGLVGCSPWGHEESDTTERLHFHFSLSCIGEGNGNPLQCSCLENLRNGGAWWAAVYGVTQSQARLKWLSSSSKLSQHKQIGVMNREYAKASGPLFKDTFNIFLTLFCAIALF